jgi:hypothetical protein
MGSPDQHRTSIEEKNYRRRFLRDGILDEMIRTLHDWDRIFFKEANLPPISLAALIQLFYANRLALQQVEQQIEKLRSTDPECVGELIKVAYTLQSGLRNTFTGIEDEKKNRLNAKEMDSWKRKF